MSVWWKDVAFCGFKQAQTYLDWQFGDSFLRKALEHIGTQKRRISCGAPLRSAPCGALPCGDHAAQINRCESRERDWRDEVLFKGTNRIFSLQVRLTVIMMV